MKEYIIIISAILVALAVVVGLIIFMAGRRKKNEIEGEQAAEEQVAEQNEKEDGVKKADTEPAVVAAEEEEAEDADDETEEESEIRVIEENGKTRYIVIKYSKSFEAKLIQSEGEAKRYYSELKNCLMSYKGVKSRISWKWETFRIGRKKLAKLRLRGKTLSVALALDPAAYEGTKYHVDSLAETKSYADTPCLYRIKNERRLKYAKELIDNLMRDNSLSAGLIAENTDYAAQYPYETTEALIERKLIKVLTDEEAQSGTMFKPADIRKSVTVQEADSLIKDEVAELLVEKKGGTSDRTKADIINIDTLSRHFEDGETVTLAEIKKRVKGFNGKVTYIKVLARGTLDKKLTVEADSFSLQAVKMIVLTGGKAVKK
ncbi:MAG: uL15 family ribosomal protein [Clostridia bacterium]|nr:uL15 family ribosomal protein [Clostridia bacterium]